MIAALIRWSIADRFVVLAATGLILGNFLLWYQPTALAMIVGAIGMAIIGVALAEPAMPAMLSRLAPPQARGTAAGLFHSCEFVGSFAGAYLAGFLLDRPSTLGLVLMFIAAFWLAISWGLPHLSAAGQTSSEGTSRPG